VETPSILKAQKNVYTPQVNHLEGYSHMPRPLAAPYVNIKDKLQADYAS
jgi:hypothetical protein